jgi:PBSX family phage terminase large subunit
MNITFDYRPLPVHAGFHASDAKERAMFGAFGSGKTYAICAEAIAWCLEQPGIRGLITRLTIPELRDTTETVFFSILPDALYKAGTVKRMGGHVESFMFPNGSVVLFRGIDDWNKHKSLNVGFIAWDEADEFDEETYMGMSSRVRQRDPTPEGKRYGAKEITRRGMWLATNPAGHNWLYRRFVDPATRIDGNEHWRSTSFDNPFLPPEYIDTLLQYPDAWVRRYVLCQFDDFAGQIYEDWAWDTHVIEPYRNNQYPSNVFWMGMDIGTRVPTAGLWVVVNEEKRRLEAIAEYQATSLSASDHAAAWRAIEAKLKMNVRWRVADPNIQARDKGTNMKLSDQYSRLGFNFSLGPRTYPQRIPMLGQLIRANRFVVTRDCPITYEQIKNYSWEEVTMAQKQKGIDPPEKPVKANDHCVDCAQYLSSRWVRPLKFKASDREKTFSQEAVAIIRKQQNQKRVAGTSPLRNVGTIV